MKSIVLDAITIYQFVWDVLDSNCYVIKEENSSLIIDPIDLQEFYDFIKNTKDATIILTHAHYDHICGLNRVRELVPKTTVICSKACSINIQSPQKNLSNIANAVLAFHEHREQRDEVKPFVCAGADAIYKGSKKIQWKDHVIELSEYHGHSPDSQCIILDETILFSGDTLLPIPTVTRLPGGSNKCFIEEDIPRLKTLQIEKVFPGHGENGKLQEMILINKDLFNRIK